jgi:hypothetical protein
MVKTNATLGSTLSNASWIQRGTTALLAAALMFALTLALQPNIHVPPSAPAVHQAAPAVRNPNIPVIGTGSAYDGGSYGTQRPATRNPNIPVIGTGSAYDGQ